MTLLISVVWRTIRGLFLIQRCTVNNARTAFTIISFTYDNSLPILLRTGWFTAAQALVTLGLIGLVVCLVLAALYIYIPRLSLKPVLIALIVSCFASGKSVYVLLSLSFSFPLSLSLALSRYHSPSLFLSFSVSLALSRYHSLSLSLSLSFPL